MMEPQRVSLAVISGGGVLLEDLKFCVVFKRALHHMHNISIHRVIVFQL